MNPSELRQELITLKTAALKAQAVKIGLIPADGDISAAAHTKIRKDVEAVPDADLADQVTRWTELKRRAILAISAQPR